METGTAVKDDLKNLLWQNDPQIQQTILDSLIEHVVIHDTELTVLWANTSACKSVALELEEVTGRYCYTIWPKRSTPCEDCPVNLSRITGVSQSIEKRTPDGRYWQISASPLFNKDGQIIALVERTLDITQRVKAEKVSKTVQINQEKIIRKRTHDLIKLTEKLKREIEDRKKTESMLRKQKGYIQQLSMELSKAEDRERQRIAELLHGDLQQMLAYLKLKFSTLRKEIDEGKISPSEFNAIDHYIEGCIERCRNLSHELKPFVSQEKDFIGAIKWVCRQMKEHYGLEVSLQATEALEINLPVLASLLIRSIRELLFNVVKHSGGKIAFIQVRNEHRQIVITVKDTGMGCDPVALQRKWDDNSAFGLCDIRDRVKFLGGCMDVEAAPGHGFCVNLCVPGGAYSFAEIGRSDIDFIANAEGIDEPSTSKPPDSFEISPIRVLLADDHTIMRNGLAELIDRYTGIEVVGMATNGLESVKLAEKHRPDVILMDVSMPVMNGIEATRQIKKLFPKIKIIGLTMHKDPEIHQELKDAGACSSILKSGALENLIETVRYFCSKKENHPSSVPIL